MQGKRGKLDNEHRYERVPKLVEASSEGKVTVLWNQQVQTVRTIPDNKPDTVIPENGKGTCRLTFWHRNYFFTFSTPCI
jgi:hypothetical protein